MKSKTSFFNLTALRKDILRYAPVWSLYTLFLLLALLAFSGTLLRFVASGILESLKPMTWINMLYASVCGVVLFSDLFKSRLCNALHAFPLRREGWLITHILSGILFSFVPNLMATIWGCFLLQEYAYISLIWLCVSTLQYVFFFGITVLCAMCAGNRLGMVTMCGITHFATPLICSVLKTLYQPLLYGIRLNEKAIYRFFPLDQLDSFGYAEIYESQFGEKRFVGFRGFNGSEWLYLGLCALAGVACLFLACILYRRRKLESSGDFLAFRSLTPVYLLISSIGVGLFFYLFSALVGTDVYVNLVLGMAVGYFCGSMLLRRTLKVFGKKSLLRFAALVVVLSVSLGLTGLDPLGVTTYVPKAENIKSASVWGSEWDYYYLADTYNIDSEEIGHLRITDPQELAQLQDYHEQLISYRYSEDDGKSVEVNLQYTLKNGKTVTRYYTVGSESELCKQAAKYFSDKCYVFETNNTEALYQAVQLVTIDITIGGKFSTLKLVRPEEIAGLLDAVIKDCEAGTMAQNGAFHNGPAISRDYTVDFEVKNTAVEALGWYSKWLRLDVYTDCTNTIDYLNKMVELHPEQQ